MSDFDDFDDLPWVRHQREEWARWDRRDVMTATHKAEEGDAEAQCRLAYYYTEGKADLEADLHKAAYWYGKAAQQGHEEAKKKLADLNAYMPVKEKADAKDSEAQYQMGLWQSDGGNEFVGLSYNAANWFLNAAQQGHAGAKERLDAIIKTPKQWNSTILSMMTEKANAGDDEAAYAVGCYYTSEQIFLPRPTHQENMAQAIKWFGKAAEQSHEEAKEKLALLTALKTTHDKAKAEDAQAQYQIGVWQSEGGNDMVLKDNHNAAIWFFKAAKQNHEGAKEALAKFNISYAEAVEADAKEHLSLYILEKLKKGEE